MNNQVLMSYRTTFSNYPTNKPLDTVPVRDNSKPPILPTHQTVPNYKKWPFKYIPADVRQVKIAKGLCYYCLKFYDMNHKCNLKEPQLFTLEVPGRICWMIVT